MSTYFTFTETIRFEKRSNLLFLGACFPLLLFIDLSSTKSSSFFYSTEKNNCLLVLLKLHIALFASHCLSRLENKWLRLYVFRGKTSLSTRQYAFSTSSLMNKLFAKLSTLLALITLKNSALRRNAYYVVNS